MVSEPIVKRCSCGRGYTLAQWKALRGGEVYELDGEVHEQRHCVCRSTIVLVLKGPLCTCGPTLEVLGLHAPSCAYYVKEDR